MYFYVCESEQMNVIKMDNKKMNSQVLNFIRDKII